MKIELFTGTLIDPEDLLLTDIKLEDIVIGLSNLCRFGGHCSKFYSVLNHSINCYLESVSRNYPIEAVKLSFCHDFSEGLGLVDIPFPLKKLLPRYDEIESSVQSVVYERFKVDNSLENNKLMKCIDADMAVYEARYLMKSEGLDSRWHEPSVGQPGYNVLERLKNIPGSELSIKEFWKICNKLGIK